VRKPSARISSAVAGRNSAVDTRRHLGRVSKGSFRDASTLASETTCGSVKTVPNSSHTSMTDPHAVQASNASVPSLLHAHGHRRSASRHVGATILTTVVSCRSSVQHWRHQGKATSPEARESPLRIVKSTAASVARRRPRRARRARRADEPPAHRSPQHQTCSTPRQHPTHHEYRTR